MSSRVRSASLSRASSSSSSRTSSASRRSNNALATVHSPKVQRSIASTSVDQSRFPILAESLEQNLVTAESANNIPPLLSDASPSTNLSTQLDSATTASHSTNS